MAFVEAMVNMRLYKLAHCSTAQIRALSPMDRVLAGLCDPWRVIVKNEPHTLEKLESGRERLVLCASVVDEIVDRLLETRPNKALIRHFCKTFSALGIGFDDEKNKVVMDHVFSDSSEKTHSDMKAWEWTFQDWDYELDIEVVIGTCDNIDAEYELMLRNRNELCKQGVYATSDGELYEQDLPGVNKSGSFKTAVRNTRARAGNSILVGSSWSMCAGDDCVEKKVDDMIAKYRRLGKNLKDCKDVDEHFDFCSHDYGRDGQVKPKNLAKAAFRCVAGGVDFQKLTQFTYVYQQSEGFKEALKGIVAAAAIQARKLKDLVVGPAGTKSSD
nr:RNA-dependent RNA polymerase [Flumine sobemo-like virus 6]